MKKRCLLYSFPSARDRIFNWSPDKRSSPSGRPYSAMWWNCFLMEKAVYQVDNETLKTRAGEAKHQMKQLRSLMINTVDVRLVEQIEQTVAVWDVLRDIWTLKETVHSNRQTTKRDPKKLSSSSREIANCGIVKWLDELRKASGEEVTFWTKHHKAGVVYNTPSSCLTVHFEKPKKKSCLSCGQVLVTNFDLSFTGRCM